MNLFGELRPGWPCPACLGTGTYQGGRCGVCQPLPQSALLEQEPCARCGEPLRAGALPHEGGVLGCRACNPNIP